MRAIQTACRRLSIAAATGIALLCWAAQAGATAAPVEAPEVPVLAWHSCTEPDQAGFDCASANVPLDYQQPAGPTISLALIRHRATQPGRRIGSLFFNPGGPGGSGVQALAKWSERFPLAVRQRFDLISWDSRGIGASTAVSCFATKQEALDFFASTPVGFPVGPTQVSNWINSYSTFGHLCDARIGDLLAHLSTADSARDLELLRRAVGEPRLTYVGITHGTLLGATYANLFPGRIRAMVLDGNIDPRAWTASDRERFLTTSLRLGTDLASNDVLNAFLDRCTEAGTDLCAFAAADAATTRAKFASLLVRIRQQPIPLHGEPVTYAALVNDMAHRLSVVPAGLGFPGWSATAELLQTLWNGGNGGAPSPKDYDEREQRLAVQCAESPNPRYPAFYRALAVFAFQRADDVGSNWAWNDEPCASWPAVAADVYDGPWNRRTAKPILVIGNSFDPYTPYEGSLAMASLLARARLLTVDGYGHTALLNPSSCADALVGRYLVSGTLPPEGTVCRQDAVPFASPPGNTAIDARDRGRDAGTAVREVR